MSTLDWRENRLRMRNGEIAVHEAGDGPPLVFLHGGPGLDHRLLRPLAEPLTREYRCILPDQRGSGGSAVESMDTDTLHINRLIEDIEDLRQHLGEQRLRLIGWSWGAALALLYGAVHPDRLELVAAIAPGPIPWEFLDVYHANRVRPLTAQERTLHADLSDQMERALRAEDAETYRALNRQLVALSIRAWFYSPEQASAYLETYLDLAGDAYNAALVSDRILGSLGEFTAWDRLGAWEAPTLVLYGYQDFEPITQAFTIQQWAPQTQIVYLNECGHYPWLEQPDRFYAELHAFLGSTASSGPSLVPSESTPARPSRGRCGAMLRWVCERLFTITAPLRPPPGPAAITLLRPCGVKANRSAGSMCSQPEADRELRWNRPTSPYAAPSTTT